MAVETDLLPSEISTMEPPDLLSTSMASTPMTHHSTRPQLEAAVAVGVPTEELEELEENLLASEFDSLPQPPPTPTPHQ
jgi:hypothetical protein